MSKYDALWAYIQGRNEETLVLSFADIAQIAGTPLEQRPDQRGICRFYLGALFVYFSVMFLSLSTAFYTNTICTVNFSLFTI